MAREYRNKNALKLEMARVFRGKCALHHHFSVALASILQGMSEYWMCLQGAWLG